MWQELKLQHFCRYVQESDVFKVCSVLTRFITSIALISPFILFPPPLLYNLENCEMYLGEAELLIQGYPVKCVAEWGGRGLWFPSQTDTVTWGMAASLTISFAS